MLRIVVEEEDRELLSKDLDEIAREGARQMLVLALDAERADYIDRFKGERDEKGHAQVVGNGFGKERKVQLGAGTIPVRTPRVDDRRVDEDGNRMRFTSEILPPFMRRSPKMTEVLPILYLRGLSTGDFAPALESLLGPEASGLAPSTIDRLRTSWSADYEQFSKQDLSEKDFVYVWADGIHFKIRLEEDRLCALVLVGVRADGTKELIAISDGYRESTESWSLLLRDLKRRGMRAPVLAVGDGALGFWAAMGNIFPETKEQRDWVHKLANILDAFPDRLRPRAKSMICEVRDAETKDEALKAIEVFTNEFGAKYPRAVDKLVKDQDALLCFFDFPADHWKHLKTTNAIESTFATVRLRTKVTKGAGSRKAGLQMAFKLIETAQRRWRRVNSPELVALLRAGVKFENGKMIESSQENAA